MDADPNRHDYRRTLAMCLYNLGHLLGSTNRLDEAESIWQESLAQWRELADDFRISEYRSRVGATLNNLAVLARNRDHLDEARQLVEKAIVHQERALRIEPVYHLAREFLHAHEKLLANITQTLGDQGSTFGHTGTEAPTEEKPGEYD